MKEKGKNIKSEKISAQGKRRVSILEDNFDYHEDTSGHLDGKIPRGRRLDELDEIPLVSFKSPLDRDRKW